MFPHDLDTLEVYNHVAQHHPQFTAVWQAISEAVYSTLSVASMKTVSPHALSPAALPDLTAENTAVARLAAARDLLEALYHDAWLEAHISGAEEETEGLPLPNGWPDEEAAMD